MAAAAAAAHFDIDIFEPFVGHATLFRRDEAKVVAASREDLTGAHRSLVDLNAVGHWTWIFMAAPRMNDEFRNGVFGDLKEWVCRDNDAADRRHTNAMNCAQRKPPGVRRLSRRYSIEL